MVPQNTQNEHPISAHAGASCTTLMGGRLGHVSARLADPGRFYGRGKTCPNADFCKIRSPQRKLVWTCQAGPSTSRGLVNTWWSQTWHRLSSTRWARHGLHAPRGMQTRPFGLHMVPAFYTSNLSVCTEFAHILHALSKHVNHE